MVYSVEIIVALSLNRVIGKITDNHGSGVIPWKLPTDMQNFRTLTLGHPVVMGRKTFLSLPDKYRPLPGRINIVLSKTQKDIGNGVLVVASIEEALVCAAEKTPDGKIFVGGGSEIYQLALPYTHRIHRSLVQFKIDESKKNVLFPDIIDPDEWTIEIEKSYPKVDFSQNEFSYVYTVARRKTKPLQFAF